MQGTLSEAARIPEIRFAQIRRRTLQLRPEIGNPNPEDAVDLAFDSSGLPVTDNGTCLERKWKRQGREYARLHVSSDPKSKRIASCKTTRGNGSDTKQPVPLLEDEEKRCTAIKSAHADRAYGDQNDFECREMFWQILMLKRLENAALGSSSN